MMRSDSKTILLVEDQHAILSLYTRLLQVEGFTVLNAGDAWSALETCEHYLGPIHLLLADIFLQPDPRRKIQSWKRPPMNGIELARRVVLIRPQTHVIFVSGHADDEIKGLGGLPPGALFLRKPFKSGDLLRIIGDVLPTYA